MAFFYSMETGFIKLHRKITEWEWYKDINVYRLFTHLLLTANYQDKRWQGKIVKRGQKITGVYSLSEETSLSVQEIRTALAKLKSTGEITINPTNKYSIVTVCNYDSYQDNKQATQQADQPATEQTSNNPSTTTKEAEESKEEKKLDANTVFECMVRASVGKEVTNDFLWQESNRLVEKYKKTGAKKLQGLVNKWVSNLQLKDKNRHISLNSFI